MRKKMEQILLEDGELFTAASGISMLPCIRPQKDILHLVRPEGIVETSEVILYRRENGSYILHRVIGRDTEGISSVGIISGYRSMEFMRNRCLEYCEDFTGERIMSIAERIGDIGSM